MYYIISYKYYDLGFCNSNTELKNLCLEYMEPWLFNLSAFVKNVDENKVKRVRIKSFLQYFCLC